MESRGPWTWTARSRSTPTPQPSSGGGTIMKSNRIRIALAALGVFVLALSLVSPASAFIRLTRANATGTGVVQAHWLESSLPLLSVINPTNADIPSATALSIVQASAETWENINTSFFTVNPVEYTGAPGQVT